MAQATEDKPFFLTQNRGFAPISAKDDLLHPESFKGVTADSATETQYFGFSVPEANIHALCYLWHRPNLRIVTGGAWVWQGIKPFAVQSELFDMRTFMNDSVLKNDLHEYRFVNGYGVKVLEPLKRFHMTYSDPVRQNSFDLIQEAVSPAVMFADGNHFEQTMKVTGDLVLRGKQYKVNCYSVRDRSWGKPRPEDIMPVPPNSWMTGAFNDGFSFNCNVLDQASGNPELKGAMALGDDQTVNGGWLYRDGKVGLIVKANKRVARAPGTLMPAGVEFEATDEFGRTIHVRGTLVAASTWQTWGNVNMMIALMRWECEGMVAYGDCQEALWNDYYNYMASR